MSTVLPQADATVSQEKAAPNVLPRLDGIDGLRGFACLMVLFGHAWIHSGQHVYLLWDVGRLHLSPWHFFAYGYGGVDIFFVLSGFCLAYPIISRPERPVDWPRYFGHRIRRIIPPYWFALALFAILSLLIHHRHIEPFASDHILEWQSNRHLIEAVLLVSTVFNTSFWTLPVEWRWYFVFPLFIWLWRRVRGSGVTAVMIPISLFSVFVYQPYFSPRAQFLTTSLPTFLPLFALGVWTAQIVSKSSRNVWESWLVRHALAGLMLSVALVALMAPLWTSPPSIHMNVTRLVAWGALGFFAVLASTQSGGVISRIASWRPLVSVGIFSYSLYLVHEPLLRMAAALVVPRHLSPAPQLLFQFLCPTVIIGFSYLFFLAFEKPFLRKSARAPKPAAP